MSGPMFEFITTNILLIAAGFAIYMTVRALPRVDAGAGRESKQNLLERWIASEIPEKIDASFNSFVGKILRKLKVFLMKVDNVISKRLQKIKSLESDTSATLGQFRKITDDNGARKTGE